MVGAPTYQPEELISYELGVKTKILDDRVSADFAIYHSEYTDLQNLVWDTVTGVFFLQNNPEAEIQGVELNVQWAVNSQFILGFSGNVTDSEIKKVSVARPAKREGDPLDFVPEYSYSANADFSFNWSDMAAGFLRVDYSRQGKNSQADRLSGLVEEVVHSEPLGLLNAHIGAEWESVTLEMYGTNLLDEDRLTTASVFGTGPQHRPRTAGIKIKYDF